MQKAGSRLHLQSLAWGRAEPSALQQTRVSAGESKTGSRDLYHWIRERVGRSAQCSVRVGCSEVTDVGRCGPGAVPCSANAEEW